MFADTHHLNADLEKAAIRRELLDPLKWLALRRAAARCRQQADVDALHRHLTENAAAAAALPLLDRPRLHSGLQMQRAGVLLLGLGLCAGWALQEAPEGLTGTLLQIGALALLVAGVLAVVCGRSLQRSPNLPLRVDAQDIARARELLARTGEIKRSAGSARGRQLVMVLMFVDATLLLALALATLAQDLVPMAQLLLAALGGALIGRIATETIEAAAASMRWVQVARQHARLLQQGTPQAAAEAEALREAYGPARVWPLRASWKDHLPAVLWVLALATVQFALLALRLFGSPEGDGTLVLLLAGFVAAMTSLGALRAALQSACLTPELAQAQRLLARFPDAGQLQLTLEADRDALRSQLAQAGSHLQHLLAARAYGMPKLELAPMDLSPSPARRTIDPALPVAADGWFPFEPLRGDSVIA